MIVWLTGYSGSGKSTVAKGLSELHRVVILDGDEMRDSISTDKGFSKEDRHKHNLRVARLAKVISSQGFDVVVSVICPLERTRQEISKEIPEIKWIYLKKDYEPKENHIYKEPKDPDLVIDQDELEPKESVKKVYDFMNPDKEPVCLFIGRWQPLHYGHISIIRKVLDEDKKVLVGMRDTKIDKDNPYSLADRLKMFKKIFDSEIKSGKLIVKPFNDIREVCYGRNVGYNIRKIKVDGNIEKISATKIRNEKT
ncbi:MAG: adenylyl-sulfate kinase [Elusimicrobiota bacterium]